MTMPKNQIRQIRSDHDTLVRLDEKFNLFTQQYALDMKELKDGMFVRIITLENKVDLIELSHSGFDPQKTVQEFLVWKDRLRIVSWLLAPIYIAVIGLIVDRFFGMF